MTALRRRDSPIAGDRLLLAALAVLIVSTPTVFLRGTMFPFYLSKLTIFWVAASVVVLVGLYRVAMLGVLDRGPRSLTVVSGAFISALVLTSVVSPQPWVAFMGLPVRGAGAFTYLLCLALLHAVFGLTRRRSINPLVWSFICAHCLVVLYALLQAYGLDPISWGADTGSVGNRVFSTLGNANFSSGYVALTLPFLVWMAFGAPHPLATRVASGAAIGASVVALVYLDSFQGQVSAMVACAVLVQWAMTRTQGDRLLAVLIVLPVVFVIAVMPLGLDAPSGLLLLGVMAGVAGCAGVGVLQDRKKTSTAADQPTEAAVRWFWSTTVAVLGMVAAMAVVFWGRIVEQVESGLDQRVEFWKVSLSIFKDSPLTGRGLETYPTYFAAHRSVDHAVNYEKLLSNSPHSVPLGILSGGGLVLAATYLAVLMVIGYFGVRAVRRADGSMQLFYGAVLAAWVAYQVQAAVSMDVAGVVYTQWVLGGILVAGGTSASQSSRGMPWKPRMRRSSRQGSSALGLRRLVTASGLIVAFVFCLGPLLAPVRADLANYRAQEAFYMGDLDTAEAEIARAIKLQPRNGYYAEVMADVYRFGGLQEDAFAEMERGAQLQPGIPYIALSAARSALTVDRLDAAEDWYEHALASDPNGASALIEAAEFYVRTGRPDRAVDILEFFESLRSPNRGAWEIAGISLWVSRREQTMPPSVRPSTRLGAGTSPTELRTVLR